MSQRFFQSKTRRVRERGGVFKREKVLRRTKERKREREREGGGGGEGGGGMCACFKEEEGR